MNSTLPCWCWYHLYEWPRRRGGNNDVIFKSLKHLKPGKVASIRICVHTAPCAIGVDCCIFDVVQTESPEPTIRPRALNDKKLSKFLVVFW
jgi:hypothetical protein